MLTITNQKTTEFTPYNSIALVYNSNRETWRVVGVKKAELNSVLYEGKDYEEAEWLYNIIISTENK
tara:strand:+ start:351 stop:548 length:198 start_codon:yes stop_codon:yes gene_type:complete